MFVQQKISISHSCNPHCSNSLAIVRIYLYSQYSWFFQQIIDKFHKENPGQLRFSNDWFDLLVFRLKEIIRNISMWFFLCCFRSFYATYLSSFIMSNTIQAQQNSKIAALLSLWLSTFSAKTKWYDVMPIHRSDFRTQYSSCDTGIIHFFFLRNVSFYLIRYYTEREEKINSKHMTNRVCCICRLSNAWHLFSLKLLLATLFDFQNTFTVYNCYRPYRAIRPTPHDYL